MRLSTCQKLSEEAARTAFTIIEMLLAVGCSAILVGAISLLTIFTAKSFNIVGNYADMDAASRNAIDVMSKEIRNSSNLMACSSNASSSYLRFTNATAGTATTITYTPSTAIVTMSKTGRADKTYLKGCDQWSYSLYNRVVNTNNSNLSFYSETNVSVVKVVNLSWTCSRKTLGSKLNTEIVVTAQIALRNKVY